MPQKQTDEECETQYTEAANIVASSPVISEKDRGEMSKGGEAQPSPVISREGGEAQPSLDDDQMIKVILPLIHRSTFLFFKTVSGSLRIPLSLMNMNRRSQPPYTQPGETGNHRGSYVRFLLRLGGGLAPPHLVYHQLLQSPKKKPDGLHGDDLGRRPVERKRTRVLITGWNLGYQNCC